MKRATSFMAQETVGHVVAALAESFAAGLECYAGWRRRQRQRNNYQIRGKADGAGTGMCAAIASLANSKRKIEEAFGNDVDVLGDEFASGDADCRNVLLENLGRLQECIEGLEKAVGVEDHPLPLADLIRVSEAVRVSSLEALHKQYQRIVVGRLSPQMLSLPSKSAPSSPSIDDHDVKETSEDIEAETSPTRGDHYLTSLEECSCNNSNHNNCEPLSPPPTPTRLSKERPARDDDTSIYSPSAASFDYQPHNSVFSVFCSEAVTYQVDVEKALPAKGTSCRCGYDWNPTRFVRDGAAMVIKDGFRITSRFLGKSHCEDGLGCVLCTSTGETETFRSVEDLKAHINSSHTKWQLLHDRDLAGR